MNSEREKEWEFQKPTTTTTVINFYPQYNCACVRACLSSSD